MFFFTRCESLTGSARPGWMKCAKFGMKNPSIACCSKKASGSTFRCFFKYSSKLGYLGNFLPFTSLVQNGCLRRCSQEIRFTGSFSRSRLSRSENRAEAPAIGSYGLVYISEISYWRPLALNGGSPVAISYMTHPSAQMSDWKL